MRLARLDLPYVHTYTQKLISRSAYAVIDFLSNHTSCARSWASSAFSVRCGRYSRLPCPIFFVSRSVHCVILLLHVPGLLLGAKRTLQNDTIPSIVDCSRVQHANHPSWLLIPRDCWGLSSTRTAPCLPRHMVRT
jgi:hypothetical protein